MNRAYRLREFVDSFDNVPMVWGVNDCTMFPALWFERESGIRLPKAVYSSRDEATRLIDEAGGLDAIWTNQLASFGVFESYGQPGLGDVGLIETRLFGLVGVIFAMPGGYWRSENGTIAMPIRKAHKWWKVPDAEGG